MSTFYTSDIIEIIENEYPNSDNKYLAEKLGISESALRTKASKLGIKKSSEYMNKIYKKMNAARKIKQKNSHKDYKMTDVERNIVVGSLIGDGTLSIYGRSKNACYRESTGLNQKEYRQWKVKMLKRLDFKTKKDGSIYSPSHPIYTELYNVFYPENKKVLTRKGLELLDNPIGLACLFMDDGSLVINNYKKGNNITLFPQIILYSQSFTKEENLLLQEHLKGTFNVDFILSRSKDGTSYILKINKRNEVYSFINLVKPYVEQIPCMKYKIDVDSKLSETKTKYENKYKDKNIRLANKYTVNTTYTIEEENIIIEMLNKGYNCIDIANYLNRPYYGLYDKVRRMKREGKI